MDIMECRARNIALNQAKPNPDKFDHERVCAYDFDYAECATPQPHSRPGAASVFYKVLDKSPAGLKSVIRVILDAGWLPTSVTRPLIDDAHNLIGEASIDDADLSLTFLKGFKKDIINIQAHTRHSYYYNPIFIIEALTPPGGRVLQSIVNDAPIATACLVPHNEVVQSLNVANFSHSSKEILSRLRLRRVTGLAAPDFVDPIDRGLFDVGTVFELIDPLASAYVRPPGNKFPENKRKQLIEVKETVVARALIAYRDGTFEPSTGPTIEYLCVRRDYFGHGLALTLFNEIESWFVHNWTLDTSVGKRILKVTQCVDFAVDYFPPHASSGRPGAIISDKSFFFQHVGFSANIGPLCTTKYLMTAGRPMDEAIRMYPGTSAHVVDLPTSAGGPLQGLYACEKCMGMERQQYEFKRCGKCKDVRYCGRRCQRADWATHKLFCNRTLEEVQNARPTVGV